MRTRSRVCLALLVVLMWGGWVEAQSLGTAFTYQGRLTAAGVPPSGPFDLQFTLFDAATGGEPATGTITLSSVVVTSGLFTVVLDFRGPAFVGSVRWIEIGVRPAGSPDPFTVLRPRHELTPTPNAVFSSVAPWTGVTGKPAGFADDTDNDSGGDITGVNAGTGLAGGGLSGDISLVVDTAVIQTRVAGCPSGSSIRVVNADGTVDCHADTTGSDWRLTGNAGTIVGTNFIGTTDNRAFEMRAGNQGVLRLEPAPGTPSIVGGYAGNQAGNRGAVVGGGGNPSAVNRAIAEYAVVAGGGDNTASGLHATVPGGFGNLAGGRFSFAAGQRAKVRGSDDGTFVWTDSQAADFTSTGVNQFLIRSAGGVGINATTPLGDLQLGQPEQPSAFRFGNAGARHHLISNRDMVFNTFDADATPNGQALFTWRRNGGKFLENGPAITLMTLADNGNVAVVGALSKGGGSFKIDHPVDPENKYLSHSFVESPDMMNIYNGNVTTGADGLATVELPAWFEALNGDFRYQLTVIGTGTWARVRVAREIEDNRFVIETDVAGTRVSWQVTGIRKDAWAEKHRIRVEEDKPPAERGRYLHPEAFTARAAR